MPKLFEHKGESKTAIEDENRIIEALQTKIEELGYRDLSETHGGYISVSPNEEKDYEIKIQFFDKKGTLALQFLETLKGGYQLESISTPITEDDGTVYAGLTLTKDEVDKILTPSQQFKKT